jgi:hypothetical protein
VDGPRIGNITSVCEASEFRSLNKVPQLKSEGESKTCDKMHRDKAYGYLPPGEWQNHHWHNNESKIIKKFK